MTQKAPLSILQVVGILIFGCFALATIYLIGKEAVTQFHKAPGIGIGRVVAGFEVYIVLFALLGAAFLLLRWRVRKALASARGQPPAK